MLAAKEETYFIEWLNIKTNCGHLHPICLQCSQKRGGHIMPANPGSNVQCVYVETFATTSGCQQQISHCIAFLSQDDSHAHILTTNSRISILFNIIAPV